MVVVDCAEGTTRQFQLQPASNKPHLNLNRIAKIFITHMHGNFIKSIISAVYDLLLADHIMGIVPLLRNILFPPPAENSPYALQDNSTVNSLFLSPIPYLYSLLAKD